nr:MAG TPA: hypothetical protein [Caudoviricetes sp.]DAJ53536.1 MAG TPA: hypothetical protein [Caudoviricetes sp.]
MQYNITQECPHQVFPSTGIQQRHIQYHNINSFPLSQYPPLLQNLRIVTPQTIDALDIEQIVLF